MPTMEHNIPYAMCIHVYDSSFEVSYIQVILWKPLYAKFIYLPVATATKDFGEPLEIGKIEGAS
jgi:hypothetical protein